MIKGSEGKKKKKKKADPEVSKMAHITQSRPDSGLVFQVKVLKTF